MESAERGNIDLGFSPKSYFWPLGLETHLLSRIKGAERKAALKRLIGSGRLEDLPGFLVESALTQSEMKALGQIHPAFMGGEYLPDLMPTEVIVARITIASTTQDVTCVYAHRTNDGIDYRVVDEYSGDTLSGRNTRTSTLPLTLGELETFFNGAWSLLDVLEMNFSESGCDVDEMDAFVVGAESEFYPEFGRLYRRRIEDWEADRRGEDVEKDGVIGGGGERP